MPASWRKAIAPGLSRASMTIGLPSTPAFTVVNTGVRQPGPNGAPARPNLPAHSYEDKQLRCVQPPTAPGSAESFGSHYLNQDAANRGAPTTRPDVNVIKIEASMWW